MVLKIIDASQLKLGNHILIEGDAYIVKSMDISKTGKHGHAKVRMEAFSITSDKKKCLVVPGHERFEVPLIEKKKAQKPGNMKQTPSQKKANVDAIQKKIDAWKKKMA